MVKTSKHDRYVLVLKDKIQDKYDSISTNVIIKNKKRTLIEIDVMAYKDDYIDVYEVKCSYRITKAKKQAKSFRKHIKKKINNIYFYCGMSESLVLL